LTGSLANKSDKPDALALDEIRVSFSKVISGRLVSVFRTALTEKGLETTGLPEAFGWLNLALEIAKSGQSIIPKDLELAAPNPRAQSTLSEKLESWLSRIENDLEPEEFLTKFRSFTLPSWDHYTHIRIAYVMLTKYGRKEGNVLTILSFGRKINKSEPLNQVKIWSSKDLNNTSPSAL